MIVLVLIALLQCFHFLQQEMLISNGLFKLTILIDLLMHIFLPKIMLITLANKIQSHF